MNTNILSVWSERYRPHTLEDYVMPDKVAPIINSFKTTKDIPNLLFTGIQGTGKSSLAKIIVNDILDCQYLYINASDESGIDIVRNKVNSFAQSMSIDGKIKVVILDEIDGQSETAQRALRNTMEEYTKITRFILTGNYRYRIIPAIQSRCQSLDIIPSLENVVKRCIYILRTENIEVHEDQKQLLLNLIKSNYPDLRKCINEIQKYSVNGVLNLLDYNNNNEVLELIFNEIKKKNTLSIRKALIENEGKFNNDYVNLLRSLFNYIDSITMDDSLKKYYLLTIAEYIYRSAFISDVELNCYACILALSEPKI